MNRSSSYYRSTGNSLTIREQGERERESGGIRESKFVADRDLRDAGCFLEIGKFVPVRCEERCE